MSGKTDLGFPKGQVAEALLGILYPGLTKQEVEAIVVCLMAHLLVEQKLNQLLNQWLQQDAPSVQGQDTDSEAADDLWKTIIRMSFFQKYLLVKPYFAPYFPEQSENMIKINTLRNTIFHGKAIDDATFDNQPIAKEETIEKIFLAAQDISMRIEKFKELIDLPHADADRLKNKLNKRKRSR
jgi:hypothetical protein